MRLILLFRQICLGEIFMYDLIEFTEEMQEKVIDFYYKSQYH